MTVYYGTTTMIEYYCDHDSCPFYHEGWCAYWDGTTELMKIRHKNCPMNMERHYKIEKIMEGIHDK